MSDSYQITDTDTDTDTATANRSRDDARGDTGNAIPGRKWLTPKQVVEGEENGRVSLYHTSESEGGLAASLEALKTAMVMQREGLRQRKEALFDDLVVCYQVYIDAVGEANGIEKLIQLYNAVYPNTTIKSTKHPMQIAVELILPDNIKQANRYARALRYLLYKGVVPNNVKQHLEISQGIDGCAALHKELTNGPGKSERKTKKTAAPTAGSPILCDAGTLDAITAHLDSETKQARADVTFKKANDGTLIIMSVEFRSN